MRESNKESSPGLGPAERIGTIFMNGVDDIGSKQQRDVEEDLLTFVIGHTVFGVLAAVAPIPIKTGSSTDARHRDLNLYISNIYIFIRAVKQWSAQVVDLMRHTAGR